MRLLFLLLFTFSTILSTAQAVMDAAFVSERFQIYNGQLNYKVWSIADFLVSNKKQFKITPQEIKQLKNVNIKQFEANYLYQEDNHWVKRLYRTIDSGGKLNSGLFTCSSPKGDLALAEVLKEAIEKDKIYTFKQAEFYDVLNKEDFKLEELVQQFSGLQIKEDWAYNKFTNKLECHIIGIAPMIKKTDKNEVFCWLYFPEVKNYLTSNEIGSNFLKRIKERKFSAEVYKTSNLTMHNILVDRSYQNDLDAWINLQLLWEKLAQDHSIYKTDGKFKIKVKGEQLKGKIAQKRIDGLLTWKYANGKRKMEIYFKGGKPSGTYKFFSSKGKLLETGNFANGLRSGKWITYYESGKQSSSKNFQNGFLEGQQIYFYDNGKIRMQYRFENMTLNKIIEEFYPNGDLKAKGTVVNGKVQGKWDYTIKIDPLITEIIKRNKAFFDKAFIFERKWKSSHIIDGNLKLSVEYKLEKSDRCLNNLCNTMTILKVE